MTLVPDEKSKTFQTQLDTLQSVGSQILLRARACRVPGIASAPDTVPREIQPPPRCPPPPTAIGIPRNWGGLAAPEAKKLSSVKILLFIVVTYRDLQHFHKNSHLTDRSQALCVTMEDAICCCCLSLARAQTKQVWLSLHLPKPLVDVNQTSQTSSRPSL